MVLQACINTESLLRIPYQRPKVATARLQSLATFGLLAVLKMLHMSCASSVCLFVNHNTVLWGNVS